MINIPFIDLRFEPDFIYKVQNRWNQALNKKEFIGGSAVTELTELILKYTQANNFIPCANGTDAMQIALRGLGIGKDDRVLLPDFTFWATLEAIVNVGAEPIIIDIETNYYQMDFDLMVQAVEKYNPKAIILVHLYGWCSPFLQEIRDYCTKKYIYLIEDAAQAMGTLYKGKSIFEQAFCATTSFYPAKVLGGAGDGGGIFTNNSHFAKIFQQLSNHGRSSHYGYEFVGWNSRLDEIQAHFLIESIKYLPARINSRRKTEKQYIKFAQKKTNLELQIKPPPEEVTSNGYLQVSLANTSYKDLSTKLKAKGINTGNVYPSPISAQIPAQNYELISKDNKHSISSQISPKIINLPLFPYMTEDEIKIVLNSLHEEK